MHALKSTICVIGQMIILLLLGLIFLGDVDNYRWIITFPGIGTVCAGIASLIGLIFGTKKGTRNILLKVSLLTISVKIIALLFLAIWIFWTNNISYANSQEIAILLTWFVILGTIFVINFLMTLISAWVISRK
ncbi:MAG: hypothetical protein WCT46_01710 [Candidatus Gracilibacteria bacterium]|jgi:hypothetical protein